MDANKLKVMILELSEELGRVRLGQLTGSGDGTMAVHLGAAISVLGEALKSEQEKSASTSADEDFDVWLAAVGVCLVRPWSITEDAATGYAHKLYERGLCAGEAATALEEVGY